MATSSSISPSPPSLAIEITSRRVTVAQVGRSSGGFVVTAHRSEPLPANVVVPALTGVNIVEPAQVQGTLKRALDMVGLGSVRRAALVIPDSVARVTMVSFQQLPAKSDDLDQLIQWQLKKSTPFPLEDAQITRVPAHSHEQDAGKTFAAVVARRDVIAQYENITDSLGIHAGLVDLSSFNVMNAVMAAGAASTGDWLVVCLAPEGATLAILRGTELMFYRHRPAVDSEPLSALVHQTAMYHEDRLGGSRFNRVWLSGPTTDAVRREISERLGVPTEVVDVRPAVTLGDGAHAPETLDSLAASVGVLLRERKAA